MNKKTFTLCAAYLVAIVLANMSVALFGPQFTILNAFLFIGLDLTARDGLHEAWEGRALPRNMTLLILTGSLLSFVLNRAAGPIALASFVAFMSAGAVDTLAYSLLGDRARLIKINGSNIASAVVDSVVFLLIAFGPPLLGGIMLGQIVAKIAGGAVWSLIITRSRS